MKSVQFIFASSALVMVAISIGLIVEDNSTNQMEAVHDILSAQAGRLKADNEILSNRAARQNNTPSMPLEQFKELLRLRGEVGPLRQQTNEVARLKRDNQQLQAESDATKGLSFKDLSTKDQFTLRQTHMQDAVSTLSQAIKNYMSNHNGQTPTNFDEMIAAGYLQVSNFVGNLGLNDFEFLKPGTVDMNGDLTILRNQFAIPSPKEDPQWGGEPIWVYVIVGDRLSIMTTPGDFGNATASPSLAH